MRLVVRKYRRLFDVERDLREVASEVQKLPGYPKIKSVPDDLISRVNTAINTAINEIADDANTAEASMIRNYLHELFDDMRMLRNYFEVCLHDTAICTAVDDELNDIEETVEHITGQKCRFGIESPAGFINDASSCIHRLAEFLQKALGTYEKVGMCDVELDASNEVREACKAWNNAVERLHEKGLYEDVDYRRLRGTAIDRRLMLRVGSAAGHETHLDLERGRIDYYDNDTDVNGVMAELWNSVGLSCTGSSDGVRCTGLNKDNIKKAAVVASAATSMDYRLEDESGYWDTPETRRYKELDKRVDEALEKVEEAISKLAKEDISVLRKIYP